MAIVKHIKSRNANYSAAINYLLFEHDEKTGKRILDESGRSILRKEFYMDGLNCDPMSFDKECELTNIHFHKNTKHKDIKSHHYIISYDPTDVTDSGLTGIRAQEISLDLAKNEKQEHLEAQENNTMITFGRKLKYLRQKNHLTQKELGIAVGFPESCADVRIAQYENDTRTPKEELMKLFASTLDVPVELFTVPVLSDPKEYEAASYWRFELGAELD